MRAYSASSEEALRARNLLKDWVGEGFVTESQYRRMEQETVCELRCTNIFLRLVLFLFTLIIAGAATALFFVVFRLQLAAQNTGIFLLIFAAISYAAAEFAVSRARLFRYGIEEALAACGASLYWGLRRRQFSFVAYAAVYGYVGVSSILIRDMNGDTAILSYFVITGVAMLVMLIQIARRFGREA